MAVHMIEVVASTHGNDTPGLSLSEIRDAMDDWVSKHSEWTADPDDHTIEETALYPRDPGTVYYRGVYRFELSDAKDNLLQKAGDKLKKKVDWYRLGYHVCDHDETAREGCSWDDEREWTSKNTASIPSDVPDFL